MTPIDQEWMDSVRSEYGHCFGCGPDNPMGLHVDGFAREGDTVTASFRPRDEFRGFHDILHGGVIATALDEILAWTSILVVGHMAVTAKLELRFRNAAPAGVDYRLEGHLVERRGRRLVMKAVCRAGDEVVAEANALFLTTGPVGSSAT
ncbi:MAG TPA: PaaI family thioesterase [Acidimicrobiia bacterium]